MRLTIAERIVINRLLRGKTRFPDGEFRRCNGFAVLESAKKRRIIGVANIVTNDGDQYYAEAAVGAPSWAVAGMRLGTGTAAVGKTDTDVTTVDAAGNKAIDGTYPMTADTDPDNTGSGVDIVSWRTSYTTAQANITNIAELAIVNNITAPTKALCHALFAATFTKTVNDTLKVFVNHTMNGV